MGRKDVATEDDSEDAFYPDMQEELRRQAGKSPRFRGCSLLVFTRWDMRRQKYAHSMAGKPCREWHRLEDHLLETAKLAGTFAAEFGAGEWGYLAGLWYDLGK